jgi:phage tail sheath gpL-like
MEAITMSEILGFPAKRKGISTAGVTIRLPQSSGKAEPFDITLYIKKPREGEEMPDPDDENSFTTTGKLTFRFGKKGSIELFAENVSQADETAFERGDEL